MEEKQLTEAESLQLIAGMIGKAKNHYHESGSSALIWGFANVIAFVLAYMRAAIPRFNFPFNPFYLLIIAAMLQIYLHRKEKANKRTITYKDEAHSYVWTAFGISVIILTFAGGIADIGYFVLPLLLLLFAIPTFISGRLNNFTPLIAGGFVCWILSVVCFFFRAQESYLLVAAGATSAWVIPGFILRRNYRKKIAIGGHGF